MKSRGIACLLAIFLGGIGIHRFYLNRPISGVIYLLFCWTLIPSLVAFLEGLTFLTFTDSEFNSKYADKNYMHTSLVTSETSSIDSLVKLSALYEKDLLTKEEFEAKKTQLLKNVS